MDQAPQESRRGAPYPPYHHNLSWSLTIKCPALRGDKVGSGYFLTRVNQLFPNLLQYPPATPSCQRFLGRQTPPVLTGRPISKAEQPRPATLRAGPKVRLKPYVRDTF